MKMRPSVNIGPTVPAFLRKLWKIVNDPTIDDLVGWSADGESFIIRNPAEFCYNLLPIYYKHNNMSSFIRQLNMYGFHKLANENGCDKDEIRFFHPCFQQDQARLLQHIKRKIGSTKPEERKMPLDQIGKVLSDVKQLKGRQESVDTQLATMKQENAALWRELALLRQKHMKQQQIVNKLFQYLSCLNAYADGCIPDTSFKTLIHFLVSLVQQPARTTIGVKRRYPLMINDGPETKALKVNPPSDGATIHEIDPEITHCDDTLLGDIPTVTSPLDTSSMVDSSEILDNILEVSINDDLDVQDLNQEGTTVEDLLHDSEEIDFHTNLEEAPELQTSINNDVPVLNVQTNLPMDSLVSEVFDEVITPDIVLSPDGSTLINAVKKPVMGTVKSDTIAKNMEATVPLVNPVTNSGQSQVDSNQNVGKTLSISSGKNLKDLKRVGKYLKADSHRTTGKSISMNQNPAPSVLNNIAAKSMQNLSPNKDIDVNSITELLETKNEKPNMAVATLNPNDFSQLINNAGEFGLHVSTAQGELETIKDMLFEGGYKLDANAFLDLFNPNDSLSLDVPTISLSDENEWPSSSNNDQLFSGSELISYNPNDLLSFDNLLEEPPEEETV